MKNPDKNPDKLKNPVGQLTQAIFSDIWGLKRVAAKFVPKLLNFDQKIRRMTIAWEILNDVNDDPGFLKRVITGDES